MSHHATATAAQRTDLLHRMLLVRRLEEHRAIRTGDEAVAVGLLSALGPQDALVAAGHGGAWRAVGAAAQLFGGDVTAAHNPAEAWETARAMARGGRRRIVAVCAPGPGPLAGVFAGLSAGPVPAAACLPVLFCRGDRLETPDCSPIATVLSVAGDDVEAVAGAVTTEISTLRVAAGPCLLGVRTPRPGHDPVALLAARMHTDHQLDDNALRAIDRDAAAQVEAVLRRHR
ncbi:hypothetical protein AB0M36_13275 [Actinoplanes sp. NPDC051346]|uniref:hypothetical protein n=1 Tax=Actinoplanes sp. NPDC051346 TaxID=3155048 RepID=UPI0034399E77